MLKYLFTAEYKDGTSYAQNAQDVSVLYPEEKKSCYSDLRLSQIKRFWLTLNPEWQAQHPDAVSHTYLVDLEDGHFEIDGIPFRMQQQIEELSDFQLIYTRRHTHNFNIQMVQSLHLIDFHFGWQATIGEGENMKTYKSVMQIA